MSEANSISTPMEPGLKLLKSTAETPEVDKSSYQSAVGSLLWISTQTRPDISFTVSQLSQHMASPSAQHWKALKHLLRYLIGTIDYGLTYSRGDNFKFKGWSNSNWGQDLNDSKSIAGYSFMVNDTAISWASKKQASVALSTCEAEYMAQAQTAQEAIWLKGFLQELDLLQPGPTTIFADNRGAIKLAENPEFHKRTKHIKIKYHFIRELIEEKELTLVYKKTSEMIADGLTKPLAAPAHREFVKLLGLE